jgi:hypothetical protein
VRDDGAIRLSETDAIARHVGYARDVNFGMLGRRPHIQKMQQFTLLAALVAATTHYAELETYAHNAPSARNASVEFDLETLSPTYRLQIGLPGTSHAFAIAERLGLPHDLVEDARSRLSRLQVEFEATLASIREAREAAAAATERAELEEAHLPGPHILRFTQTGQPERVIPINVTEDSPPVPRVINFDAAQAITATQDFTLEWEPFANASGDLFAA